MWCNQITVKFKNHYPITVLVFLEDTDSDGKETVKIQSMVNEYYLAEYVTFESRDAAYEFIKHYPKALAKDFVLRQYTDTTGESI